MTQKLEPVVILHPPKDGSDVERLIGIRRNEATDKRSPDVVTAP